MEVPDPGALERATDYSAVKLFLEAVRRTEPRFTVNADHLRDVVRICRLVDGMPLGVLLAAGWAPMLTPAEIAVEIEQRLDFLETDLRGIPKRQRSVRAVFDHSWRLLTAHEQDVLGQLSVFPGGFTRRAAQAVTGATLRALKGLVEKSLLQHTTAPSTGLRAGPATGLSVEGRYELHELLRQYAAEKLDADPGSAHAARNRHSAYYAGILERRVGDLKGARQQIALMEIEADAENARAAWDWAVERGQVEQLAQALEGLGLFYECRGRYEQGERACQRAAERLAAMESSDTLPSATILQMRALCLAWRGVFQTQLGYNEAAQQLLQHSLSLLDRPTLAGHDTRSARAFALRCLGNPVLFMGHYEAARDLLQQSLALYRELDDRWEMANTLSGLGWATWNLDEKAEAERWHREALTLRRALGDQRGIAESCFAVCQSVIPQGRPEEGEKLAREAITIGRETGDRVSLAWGLYGLGWALREGGRNDEAQSVLEETVAIWEDLGSSARLAFALADLGDAHMHLGHYQDARARLQRSLKLARETDYQLAVECALVYQGWLALGEAAHSEALRWFQESMSAVQSSGRRATMMRALAGLGLAERGLGNLRSAKEHLHTWLETANDLGFTDTEGALHCAGAMALVLADEGHEEQAVELYAMASRYPWVANSRWWEDVVGNTIAAASATLPPDVVAVAQERGRERDMAATVRDLVEELAE